MPAKKTTVTRVKPAPAKAKASSKPTTSKPPAPLLPGVKVAKTPAEDDAIRKQEGKVNDILRGKLAKEHQPVPGPRLQELIAQSRKEAAK